MPRRNGKAPQPASSSLTRSQRRADRYKAGEKLPSHRTSARPSGIQDVYDFAVQQQDGQGRRAGRSLKRIKSGFQGEEGEGRDEASGDEDGEHQRKKGTTTYLEDSEDEEANAVAEEDDSDIDSDEAFASEDEERYEDVDFRRGASSSKGQTFTSRDAQEPLSDGSLDVEEEEEGSDVVDLSKMLEEDSSDEAGQHSDVNDDDEEDYDDKDGHLRTLASTYAQPTSKRTIQDEQETPMNSKRQRRVLSERTEAIPESDFAAPSRPDSSKRTLALDDLLAPLSSATPGSLTALRSNVRGLGETSKHSQSHQKASRRGGGALSAPLPAVVKDRLQRAAGYELSREEAEKWQPTIKRLREAEHLSFPLQGGPSRPKATTSQMAATYKPTSAFEADIEKILQGEGLSEAQISKSEELAMRQMDPEEVARRREELRKMRDLMFRAEQKAKRVSKIKSKTYRKIARKDKEKEREKLREAGVFVDDQATDDDEDQEGRAKAERDRAKERATLKHKNTGKWAKAMLGRKDLRDNEDAQHAIDEQLQRSEALRRKIHGFGDSASDESSDSEDEDGGADPRQQAFDELKAMDDLHQESDTTTDGKKGVWNMKFMKDARNRDAATAEQDRQDFERELLQVSDGDNSSKASDDSGDEAPMIGRRKLGGGQNAPTLQTVASRNESHDQEPRTSSITTDTTNAPDKIKHTPQVDDSRSSKVAQTLSLSADQDDTTSNPWLTGQQRRRTDGQTSIDKGSTAATKSARKLEKRKGQASQARADAQEDAQVDIDPMAILTSRPGNAGVAFPTPAPIPQKRAEAPAERGRSGPWNESSLVQEDEDESDEPVEVTSSRSRAKERGLSQRDLIAEAFAGDDVAADFASEKARQIEADAPREVDTCLPGWGSWGGKGIKKKSKAKTHDSAKAKLNLRLIPGLDPSQRRDANMSNVIINERKDKKAEKYKAKEVPYPYTSAEQYEASLAQPLGNEWNTLTQNQRLTMPRVLKTKPGTVIKPIQRVG